MTPSGARAAVLVSVPATSANLGPGFDALGLALGLYDEVEVEAVAGEPGSVRVEVQGEGADDVPRDARHLVVRALHAGRAALGEPPPAVHLRCRNSIPHGRGLGSSSAAIVAGLAAARALTTDGAARLPDRGLLALAARLEGHPDNVAPALLGGLTVAWTDDHGAAAVRLAPAGWVRCVALVPLQAVATEVARGLLPGAVPHGDAARNAGRAALLVAVLSGTAGPEHLLAATEDRLHQEQRRTAMPDSLAVVDRLRRDGVAAVVSGAGPTVLVLGGPETSADRLRDLAPAGWRALALAPDADGVRVDG